MGYLIMQFFIFNSKRLFMNLNGDIDPAKSIMLYFDCTWANVKLLSWFIRVHE